MDEAKLSGVFAFVEVARCSSFVAAAKTLGTTPATVSRRVARLEDSLGARLFTRTTRHVILTDAGRNYLQRCEPILKLLDDVDLSLANEADEEPRGTLRISMPGAFGRRYGAAMLATFRNQYPQLLLEISLTDRIIDIVDERIDVAIRLADLPDSNLIARKLAPNHRILCASPALIKKQGTPTTLADLNRYNCLLFSGYEHSPIWQLHGPDGSLSHRINPTVMSNDIEVLYEMILTGHGVTMLPTFIAGPAIHNGLLMQVLPQWKGQETFIWAIHPSRRLVPAKVRYFVDYLVKCFANHLPWDDKK